MGRALFRCFPLGACDRVGVRNHCGPEGDAKTLQPSSAADHELPPMTERNAEKLIISPAAIPAWQCQRVLLGRTATHARDCLQMWICTLCFDRVDRESPGIPI